MRIFWLLPEFAFSSATRQASLIVPELIRAGHDCLVAALHGGGPFGGALPGNGVPTRELSTKHDFPLHGLYKLHALIRDWQPDVIHAWRLPVIRSLAMLRAVRRITAKQIVSQPRRGVRPNNLDRWLIRRFPGRVDPSVPLAVGSAPADQPCDPWRIACVGNITRAHGFFDALWAYDVLRYVLPEMTIEFTGDGPERRRLAAFAATSAHGPDGVVFRGAKPDGPERLASAAMAWIPSRAPASEQVALEAQAAGTPVIATNLPSLASVIADNVTGVLVPPGDPVAIARAARKLFENREEARRLGDAGREQMKQHRPIEIATRWLELYEK